MLRIHGRLSLAAALLCAGFAQAGSAAPAKKSADDDKIMTINDGGKAHRCQVLRSYKHPSGGMAYEVKDLESGEIMTVIESAAAAIAAAQPVEAVRHADPVIRLIGCLRDDLLPSMREIAAETLARGEGRNRPVVVAALEEAAEKDPAPSVRDCCTRCLSEMRG